MTTVDLLQLLGATLLSHDEEGVVKSTPTADLRGKTIGIYFSAHWCPPCRQFTPKLASTYAKLQDAGNEFEVVFVSSDRSLEQFQEYFAHMPWKAVPFDDAATRQRLSREFGVAGIPTLVIVGPGGRVLTTHGREAVMRDPEGLNFPWEGAGPGAQGILGNPMLMLLLFLAFWKFSQYVLGLLRG